MSAESMTDLLSDTRMKTNQKLGLEGQAQDDTGGVLEREMEMKRRSAWEVGWKEEKCLGGPDEGWGWPAGRLGSPGPRISLWT